MTLVEQVARAIAEQRYDEVDDFFGGTREEWVEMFWNDTVPAAIAALKAIRVPTEAMKVAGSEAWSSKPQNSPTDRWVGPVARTFTAMIDAALTEQEQT